MKRNWILSFVAILIIALLGVSNFEVLSLEDVNAENAADITWMLTASCLVFFMTPGLSFFLWWNGKSAKYYFNHVTEFYCFRTH